MATNTTTTTANPWGPQATGLEDVYGKAKSLFGNLSQQPYDPYGATSKSALAGMKGIASGGNPFLQPATDAVTGITSGANGITTGSMFGDVYGQSQQPGFLSQGMYGDIASGGMIDNNPYRQAALQDALDQTSNAIKASMSSAGRYGSGAYGEGMARGLGGVAANFNLDAYNSDMDRMMAAAQGRSSEDIARQGIGLSALTGMTGVQGQNISNQLAGATLAPTMDQFRYSDAERLAQVGAAEDAMQSEIRDRPQELLNWYKSIFGSPPGTAGTSTTESPGQSEWLNILGGGSAGAGIGSMFGPVGSLVGGGLGALGSWLFG